jgi:hypothetical protein
MQDLSKIKSTKELSKVLKENEKTLKKLQKSIAAGFTCELNGVGMPCNTDRWQLEKDMQNYIDTSKQLDKIKEFLVLQNNFQKIVKSNNEKFGDVNEVLLQQKAKAKK